MPLPADPAPNPSSPFASMRGHHTGIRYPDFEDARSFWVDKLDWRVLQIWPYGDLTLAYVSPPNQDEFHLEILAGPGAEPQAEYADVDASLVVNGYNHVCLSVDSVDDTLAELRRRGVDVVNEPFELDDISARLAFFRDPWGNMFELSERLPGAPATHTAPGA
ncbi:VOC family protein [Herbiconiux daphne]|uniref:VOC family protein n=1 Tax=Herbiconiux daphne TaxID=2970914 RepID=A0ABT2GZW5_9MICO|nr:VOC family protein [Herbiconiux daphne]MCS5732296.1 VOC family protein [Herbiconiux daphne]